MKPYGLRPIMVLTWPGMINPSTLTSPESSRALIASGTVLWEERMEKFFTPSRAAAKTVPAMSGDVVSKPVAKKTTCFAGSCCASFKGVQAFATSAAALGVLAATYFLVYTAMQLPCGVLADTLGPR